MHYALRTQRSWGSVSRDSWKIGERSRSERSRYEREQTTRYGTIWLDTAEQRTFLRASCYTFSERRCLDLLPGLCPAVVLSSVLRFCVNTREEKAERRNKKPEEKERNTEKRVGARRNRGKQRGSNGETREEKRKIYQKPEGVQRGCFAFDPVKTQHRDFLSLLDKFKLDWPCVQLNLWGSLRLKEQSMGCRVSTRNSL